MGRSRSWTWKMDKEGETLKNGDASWGEVEVGHRKWTKREQH